MKLEKFLYCMTLRTTGLILGYLGAICCGIILIYNALVLLVAVGNILFTKNENGRYLLIYVNNQCLIGIFRFLFRFLLSTPHDYCNIRCSLIVRTCFNDRRNNKCK